MCNSTWLRSRSASSSPVKLQEVDAAANELLDELDRDVRLALDQATQLAQSIYPSRLDTGGLVVALRSAAASAGIPVSIDVGAGAARRPG